MEELLSSGVLLLDGGLSNDLDNRVKFDIHKEPLWTAKALSTDPDAVIATHLEYLRAGADIIETASYQATLEGFKEFSDLPGKDAEKIIKKSVELAKTAIAKFSDEASGSRGPRLVAGSIGPYGVYLRDGSEYSGVYMKTVSQSQIEDMHLPRIRALVEGGIDVLAIETMPSLEEVEIILNLLKTHFPSTKAWVSFSIKEGNPSETAFGDSMKVAAEKLANSTQVIAFGINCCMPADVESFLKQVKEYKTSRTLKTIIYPNSGQQWIRGQGWIKNPVPSLDSYLETWMQLGVGIVGGCCQVGTDQIKTMRQTVDKWNAKSKMQPE